MDGLNPQHMWEMLTDLSENDPEQYAKFMKETMASAAPPSAATPEPGYVVKLRTPAGCPPFLVNVCAHPRIEPVAADGTVPLAVGLPRSCEFERERANVVDVVVHAGVTARAAADAGFRAELTQLARQCVAEVLGEGDRLPSPLLPGCRELRVASKYVGAIVPFADARGPPPSAPPPAAQRPPGGKVGGGGDLPASLIEQLSALGGPQSPGTRSCSSRVGPVPPTRAAAAADGDGDGDGDGDRATIRLPGGASAPTGGGGSSGGNRAPLVQEVSSGAAEPATPEHEASRGADGALTLRVALPAVRAASELDVQVGDGAFVLSVEGVYRLRVALPDGRHDADVACKFDKKKRVLTVRLEPT